MTPPLFADFAGRLHPLRLADAKTPDADGYMTNVTCLHGRAGAASYAASIVVGYGGRVAKYEAEVMATRLRRLGYQFVTVRELVESAS